LFINHITIKGNVPALTRLVKAYITKDIGGIFDRGQIEPILGVFQKLNASKLNDQYGVELLQSIFTYAPE
jgi:exportin-2 (importin alpha re-exporter)